MIAFLKADLKEQHSTIKKNNHKEGIKIFRGFFEIIDKLQSRAAIVLYILSNLDGIISFNGKYINYFKLVLIEQYKYNSILNTLNKFLYLKDYSLIVYDISAKLLAVVYSKIQNHSQHHRRNRDFLE